MSEFTQSQHDTTSVTSSTGLRHSGVRYYTPAQVMEVLQLSENTVYHELQYGALKAIAFRIGRQWRVSAAELENLFASPGERS